MYCGHMAWGSHKRGPFLVLFKLYVEALPIEESWWWAMEGVGSPLCIFCRALKSFPGRQAIELSANAWNS